MEISDTKYKLIHENNLTRSILKLSLPIMLINLIMTFYNLTDAFFVSNISTKHFAAISIVFPVIYSFSAIAVGLKVGSSTIIAQNIGAKNYKEASRVFTIAMVIAIVFSIIITILGYLFIPYILHAMSNDEVLTSLSITYTRIVILGTPFVFFFTVYQGLRQALGDTLSPVIIQVVAVLVNVVLDYIFIIIFGFGIEGAAYATVIAQFLFVPYIIYKLSKKDVVNFDFKVNYKDFNYKKFFHVSIPAMLSEFFMALSFMILNSNALLFGTNILAASAAGNRINAIVQIPLAAFAQVLSTFVAQLYGAKNYVRAKKSFYTVIKLSIIFGAAIVVVLIIFNDFALGLFLKNVSVHDFNFAKRNMMIVNINMIFLTCMFASIASLNSFSKTRISLFLNITRLWIIRIPLFYLIKDYFGIETIWIAMFVSTVVTSSISFYFANRIFNNLLKGKSI